MNAAYRRLVERCLVKQNHIDYFQSNVTRDLLLDNVIHPLRVFINLNPINQAEKFHLATSYAQNSKSLINCDVVLPSSSLSTALDVKFCKSLSIANVLS